MSNEQKGFNPKKLNPAVLGMPSSHGAKLTLMTSEDKKEFMKRLEEWRKARKEKLAAKILVKQKLPEKSRPAVNPSLPKTKSACPPSGGISRTLNRESVFERLYKGNGNLKRPDYSNEITERQSTKKPIFTSNDSLKVLEINALPKENSKLNKCGFESGKNFNGFSHPTTEIEISTETATENSTIITDSTLKVIAQDTERKHSELKTLKGKCTLTKKPVKCSAGDVKNCTGKTGVKVPIGNGKVPLRRSISMSFREKNKRQATIATIRRSISAKNIHELEKVENCSVKKSILFAKSEATVKPTSFLPPKTKHPFPPTHLTTKLENWLKINGHPLEGYRHLRCFGIDNFTTPLRSASSNTQPDKGLENCGYSDASSSPLDESNKENMTPPTALAQADVSQVENWLKELLLLVVDLKYPKDRCEEWLAAIRSKYPKCSQLPVYWECIAALNESNGEMKSDVKNCDERASIEGSEIESGKNSLTQLFDKMVIEQRKLTKSKLEKGIDPKNIFKSTTIKFSLQHKTPKKLGPEREQSIQEQIYIATPVRRSTRVQTPFKSNEVVSLGSLTPEVKKNLTFKPNESLLEID